MNTAVINFYQIMICQIEANCSPFQSVIMPPFHIRLERLKLFNIKFSNIKFYFKTDALSLEFDSNYFGILLWKIVQPRDHNYTKLPK